MKKLFLVIAILLTACGETSYEDSNQVVKAPEFTEIFPEFKHRDDYNGIYTQHDARGWSYKSHMVPHAYEDIPGVYCHFCRKVMTHYSDDKAHTPGRETKTSLIFRLDKYNYSDPPNTAIVYQQWQPKLGEDNHVTHPVTTLKLVPIGGVSIGLFNHGWQYDYTQDNPYNPDDPLDRKHQHPEAENSGFMPLSVGRNYYIELTFYDGLTPKDSKVTLTINNQLIATSYHQTRSEVHPATILWGLYWQGGNKNGYNGGTTNKCGEITGEPDLVCKSIQTTVLNFRVYERINL